MRRRPCGRLGKYLSVLFTHEFPAFVVPRSAVTRLHRLRFTSLLAFWNSRGLSRPTKYTIAASALVWLLPRLRARDPRGVHNLAQLYPFGVVFGKLGAPQAAEKILERTCVQF